MQTLQRYIFRLTTRVRRKITRELDPLRREWVKGTFFLGKSFSSLLITFSEKISGGGVGGAAVKWKGDVRTVISVSTRVSIARGLSTMQEMQV